MKQVLVIDLCPQANSSGMLLGGMGRGEAALDELGGDTPPKTISGYMEDRITSPYVNPHTGSRYLTRVYSRNSDVPDNVRDLEQQRRCWKELPHLSASVRICAYSSHETSSRDRSVPASQLIWDAPRRHGQGRSGSRLGGDTPPKTISGYMEDRITSPYVNPHTISVFASVLSNSDVPDNVQLV